LLICAGLKLLGGPLEEDDFPSDSAGNDQTSDAAAGELPLTEPLDVKPSTKPKNKINLLDEFLGAFFSRGRVRLNTLIGVNVYSR
jgi:hypothetical protein